MTEQSKSYGEALYLLAAEGENGQRYADALDTVGAALAENPDYLDLLACPSIPKRERCEQIERAFGASLPDEVVSFLKLLCERGHIALFPECAREYHALLDAAAHVLQAKVRSAVALSEQEREKLKKKLEEETGHTVILECIQDPAILGGIIVEIDGRILDGSLRRRMRDVKEVIGQ